MIKIHAEGAGACDVLTVAQMRAAEAVAMAAGTSGLKLMERAGRAVVAAIAKGRGGPGIATILCGPGNNGGDGYVVARLLRDRGWTVGLVALTGRAGLVGDAAAMAALWDGPILPPETFDPAAPCDVLVDALFGTGLSRPLEGVPKRLVLAAGKIAGAPLRVAVDMPSGVNGDSGAAGEAAFAADLTVTFHALKPGHLLAPGRRYCGEIVVADIGLGPEATARGRAQGGGPAVAVNDATALVARIGADPFAHKYTKGHALVLAGGLEGTGAARLAARAALRVGAGLVTLGVPPSALIAHAGRSPDALMVRRCEGPDGLDALLADRRRNAVVIGPAYGVGEATRLAVAAVLGSGRAVVLDADALTSFSGHFGLLKEASTASGRAVLTPHDGEFRTLCEVPNRNDAETGGVRVAKGPAASRIPHEFRLQRALSLAAELLAVVVLKGPDTIIAAPDGRAEISITAPPWLGTAGSGDVLSGLIGGLMAQGFSPYESACCGVYLHALAGRRAGRGLIADDLPEAVAAVLAETAPPVRP